MMRKSLVDEINKLSLLIENETESMFLKWKKENDINDLFKVEELIMIRRYLKSFLNECYVENPDTEYWRIILENRRCQLWNNKSQPIEDCLALLEKGLKEFENK